MVERLERHVARLSRYDRCVLDLHEQSILLQMDLKSYGA